MKMPKKGGEVDRQKKAADKKKGVKDRGKVP